MEKNNYKKKRKRDLLVVKHLSQSESIAIVFYLFLALVSGGRGVAFLSLTEPVILESEWYMALHQAISLNVWGSLLLVLSVLLLLSIVTSPSPVFWLAFIANSGLAIIFILLSGAAIENSLVFWNFYINMLLALAHSMLAVIGGYWLWIKKKKTFM